LAIGKRLEMKMKKSTMIYFSVFFGIILGGMMIVSAIAGDGYMSKIKKLVNNATVENYVGPFLTFGVLAEDSPIIEHASVGFEVDNFVVDPTPENGWTGDEYFANVISQCVFHSQENFAPLCVICRLKDANGNVIAAGSVQSFSEKYIASSIVRIDLEPDPENPLSNDVQKAHNVEINICQLNKGCTPGYWRQDQHFGSWDPDDIFGLSPVNPLTTFRVAFDLEDLNAPITMKTKGGTASGPAPTLVDTFGNPSDDITLLDAVWAQGDDENKMGRHATASLLNAVNDDVMFNTIQDVDEIIRLVHVAYGKIADINGDFQAGDFNEIADVFVSSNELECPLGNNPLKEAP